MSFWLCSCNENSTDDSSNKAVPVTINSQVWMSNNLEVTEYRNGEKIPQVTDSIQWGNLTTGAWCYYNNDPSNGKIYGKLYNWYAIKDPRGLAPAGWHIPSDSEWTVLENFLGGASVAGGKMKESGTTHWQSPNTGATNESGFSALPSGWRDGYTGNFNEGGTNGTWWSATDYYQTFAWYRFVGSGTAALGKYGNFKGHGFSVRCIKD